MAMAASPSGGVFDQDFLVLKRNYDYANRTMIGTGAFGTIFKIHKNNSDEVYALKTINMHNRSPQEMMRIRRERAAWTQLDSKYIVKLHAAFRTSVTMYFLMDYAPNKDLFHNMYEVERGVGPLHISSVRFYSAQLVLALEHLRSHGLVHRDIKLENVVLDQDWNLKLADFGMVKQIADKELTFGGTNLALRIDDRYSICGSMENFSPEVCFQSRVTFSTDLWGLGLMTYEMYTAKALSPLKHPRTFGVLAQGQWEEYANNHFSEIGQGKYTYPYANPDPQLKDVIYKLTQSSPEMRLGADDIKEVQSHPFFHDIPWSNMESFRSPGLVRNNDKRAVVKEIATAKLASVKAKAGNLKAKAEARANLAAENVLDTFDELSDDMHDFMRSKNKKGVAKEYAASKLESAKETAEDVKGFFKRTWRNLVSPPPPPEEDEDEKLAREEAEYFPEGVPSFGASGYTGIFRRPKAQRDVDARPVGGASGGAAAMFKPTAQRASAAPSPPGSPSAEKSVFKEPMPPSKDPGFDVLSTKFDYDNKELLCEGGIAKVYKIAEKKTGRHYALKQMEKGTMDERIRTWVRRERIVLKLIDSPFIIKLHCSYEDLHRVYLMLDLADNGDLHSVLYEGASETGLDIACVRYFAAELVMALVYLRSINYVHRDIKSDNVVFDANWHMKLTDFGAAKKMGNDQGNLLKRNTMDKINSRVGTPGFMSPEVYSCLAVTYGTDLWHLGFIVFEMYNNDYLAYLKVMDGAYIQRYYRHIEDESYKYKIVTPDPDLKDLVRLLTRLEPEDRLGTNNLQDVQNHPFFRGIDWDNLVNTPSPGIKVNREPRHGRITGYLPLPPRLVPTAPPPSPPSPQAPPAGRQLPPSPQAPTRAPLPLQRPNVGPPASWMTTTQLRQIPLGQAINIFDDVKTVLSPPPDKGN